MRIDLFATRAEVYSDADGNPGLKPRHVLELRISVEVPDPTNPVVDQSTVRFQVGGTTSDFKLIADHTITEGRVGLDTVELELKLDAKVWRDGVETADTARAVLGKSGLAGFSLQTSATLSSVKIVLRPSSPAGGWSAKTPFFTLKSCWILNAKAKADAELIGNTGTVSAKADASASLEVCAAFACIRPPLIDLSPIDIDIDDLLVGFDIGSFAIGTGWLSLGMIDFSGLSPFHMDGFGRWFADLVRVPGLNFDGVPLPNWTMDVPALPDLPLGIRFQETELSLRKLADGYEVAARLEGLVFSWDGTELATWDDFRADVRIDSAAGSYEIDLRLIDAYFPKTSEEADQANTTGYSFVALPFDALSMTATCWRLRIGLHSGGKQDDLGHVCIDTLLEVGGLKVSSGLTGGKKEALFETDLRLHMRNFSVLIEDPAGTLKPETFFDFPIDDAAAQEVFETFKLDYDEPRNRDLQDTFTFARDLSKPNNDPVNDYGITFLDGDFRKSERLYLAWAQKGTRFLDALSHDLFATPPEGLLPDGAADTYLALEVAWLAEGDTQLRLDWLDGDTALVRHEPQKQMQWTKKDDRYELSPVTISSSVALPPGGKGVALAPFPASDQPIRIGLPGLNFDFARPNARSIVVRNSARADSVAYVFHYDKPTGPPDFAAQVARAEIGFGLVDPETGQRDVINDAQSESEPFLTLATGHSRDSGTAIRVLGWREGEKLRFVDTIAPDASPPKILAIKAPPSAKWQSGCPVPPPPPQPVVPMAYDDFTSPDFSIDAWQIAFRFGALDKVMDLFGSNDNASPAAIEITKLIYEEKTPDGVPSGDILIETELKLTLDILEKTIKGQITFRFDPSDGGLSIEDGATLTLTQERGDTPGWAEALPLPEVTAGKERVWAKDMTLIGLEGFLYADFDKGTAPKKGEPLNLLELTLDKGRLSVGLAEEADLVMRYDGLGRDALHFLVEEFDLGPGGLNLNASLVRSEIRVRGLEAPFNLKRAQLQVVNSKVEMLTVAADGTLPRILDNADISLTATFSQDEKNRIDLDELICELKLKDTIKSADTRFEFDLDALEMRYSGTGKERSFFFVITGSAQFSPKEGEFQNGLLENLKSVRCDFVEAPISDEFFDNVEFMVELNEPVTFNMYDLFRMEIRSIGFDPRFDDFADPTAAIVIGGQCEFANIGDVISAEIDFHACRIGLPAQGESVPQIHFEGLRVDISSPEGFRIAGQVKRYETDLMRGFAGEGTVGIPGFPELSAAFSFVRLRADENSEWKHAWFVAVEASKFSVQVPPLPIHLRQVGLGFGYRYTLPLIKEFEDDSVTTLQELIERMLKALDRHQTLARIDSWVPDPEVGDRPVPWTVALEAVFTVGTKQSGLLDYNAKKEKKLKTLVAQVIAAIRSDFTLVAAAKIWFPVSVNDFFHDEENMRNRPLVRGFMIYSAPQRRFLAHAAKHENPYLGKEDDPWPKEVHALFRNSHFEATLLIEPGLLHAELGWPDRLMYRWSIGSLKIEIRAGVLMRIENDAIVQGIFLSARGSMELSGGINLGFTGVRLTARVDVYFATRLMTALYLSRPLDSKIYAEIGLDVAVRFSVQAWLRLKLGFVKINISISFGFSVQIVVGLQMGWNGIGDLGFKGRATVVINIFGRGLRAGIAVGINEGAVNGARAALLPYMSSFLAPGEPPRVPDGNLLNERQKVLRSAEGTAGPGAGLRELALDPGPNMAPLSGQPITSQPFSAALAPEPSGISEIDALADFDVGLPGDLPFAPLTPAPEKPAIIDGFVLSKVSGKRATYLWIMPGPNQKTFYPVPKEDEKGRTSYATLGNVQRGTRYFSPEDQKFIAVKVEETSVDLRINFASGAKYEAAQGGSESGTFSVRSLLAACYTLDPSTKDDWLTPKVGDPRSFPEDYDSTAPLKMPGDLPFEARMDDVRLEASTSTARNPKRELDPDDPYDRALIDAIEATEARRQDPDEALSEQAFGMQSFLMQGFYDDLLKLADGKMAEVLAETSRPTILDLGMVLEVDADAPDWANRLDLEPSAVPTLQFDATKYAQPGARDGQVHKLRPVIDFTRLNFHQYPPVFERKVSFQDEEVVAIGWKLGWGGGTPDHADGAEEDPEAYLKCYHVRILDQLTRRTLSRRTIKPCDLVGAEAQGKAAGALQRLRPRYQLTVPLSELLDAQDLGGQIAQGLMLTVTPEDQSGGMGQSTTFVTQIEPSLTPLPPDAAECRLAVNDDGKPEARLSWVEPALPDRPGVAGTEGWEMVLRPLQNVPMGSYPDEAVEAEERGLMSVTGQALADGDIRVNLKPLLLKPLLEEGALQDAPAGTHLQVDLLPFRDPDALKNAPVIDPDDNPIEDGHPSYPAWVSFCDGVSAAHESGRAWRVFLRAFHQFGTADAGINKRTWSGLSPVRLTAQLEFEPGALDATESEIPPLRARPLPHFEWPDLAGTELAAQIIPEPRAEAGPLHVPTLTKDGDQLRYVAAPSRERVIKVDWPAVPLADSDTAESEALGYAANAEFAVYGLDLDRLLNADIAATRTDGFSPDWQRVARVLPADRRVTGETPDTMTDAQNWLSWSPSFAASHHWQYTRKIAAPDAQVTWPGWYGWGESYLEWPDPLDEVAASFEQVLARTTRSPGEICALRAPRQVDENEPKPDVAIRPLASLLAAWFANGQQEAGGRLHPWLALLVGWIASQRMAQFADPAIASQEVDQVQISTNQPVVEPTPNLWLAANSAAVDPVGREALGHLGLGLTLALRDPISGLTRPQDSVRERVETAANSVRSTVETVVATGEGVETLLRDIVSAWGATGPAGLPGNLGRIEALIALPVEALKELRLLDSGRITKAVTDTPIRALRTALADMTALNAAAKSLMAAFEPLQRHFALDVPIKTQWARAASADTPMLDVASLRMLNLALRPLPRVNAPETGAWLVSTTVSENLLVAKGSPVTLKRPMRVFWRDRAKAPQVIARGTVLNEVLELGESVYALAVQSQDEEGAFLEPMLPEGWAQSSEVEGWTHPLPLSEATPGDGDAPFGRFGLKVDTWNPSWPNEIDIAARSIKPRMHGTDPTNIGAPGVHFARALTYLMRAFAPDPEADPQGVDLRKLGDALLAQNEVAKAVQQFCNWSARFFDAAPLHGLIDASAVPSWLSDTNLKAIVSAPKSVDPVRSAARGDGRMQVVLPVEAEWATTRSFAVLSTDRYAKLRRSMTKTSAMTATEARLSEVTLREMLAVENRADIRLPRIRKMEPPQVLSQRVHVVDGQPYHFLSVAQHAEEWLQNSSLPIRRKIDFGATTRSYSREPLDWVGAWNSQLAEKGWITEQAQLAKSTPNAAPTAGFAAPFPEFKQVKLKQLSDTPEIRFGGNVHITAADPFWYQTTVTLGAFGGAVVSRSNETALNIAPALPPAGIGANPVEVTRHPQDWPVVSDIGTEVAGRLARWARFFRRSTREFLAPQSTRVAVRLPRLIESLPAGSTHHGGIYGEEGQAKTLGMLPDPQLALHLVHNRAQAEASIARLTARPGSKIPYVTTMLDDALRPIEPVLDRARTGENWSGGLWVDMAVRWPEAVAVHPAPAGPAGELSFVPHGDLTDDPSERFPATDNMLHLLPLSLRLHQTEDRSTVTYTDPLYGHAWLCEPLLPRTDPQRLSQRSLNEGLSLVLDRFRRHAVAWLVKDIADNPDWPSFTGPIRDLARIAIDARVAHLSQTHFNFDPEQFPSPGGIGEWGIFVWGRIMYLGLDYPEWRPLEDIYSGDTEEIRFLVTARHFKREDFNSDASFEDAKRGQFDQIHDVIARLDGRAAYPPPSVTAHADYVSAVAADLAAQGYHADPLPEPEVFVQRGNQPRVRWESQPPAAPAPEVAPEAAPDTKPENSDLGEDDK